MGITTTVIPTRRHNILSGISAADHHTEILQANQAAIEAETNENTYTPPDLLRHAPGAAKAFCAVGSDGAISANSYNITSTGRTGLGTYNVIWDVDFANANYSTQITCKNEPNTGIGLNPATNRVDPRLNDDTGSRVDDRFSIVAHGDQ